MKIPAWIAVRFKGKIGTIVKLPSRGGVIPANRVGAAALVLAASILLAGCSGLKSSNAGVIAQGSPDTTLVKPGNAQSAVLADIHGTVQVKTGDGEWTVAEAEQTLTSGQFIRTGALSNANLTFFDGSRTYLGAEAEMMVEALDARTSGARIVQLTQVSGESRHEVAKSEDPGSHFTVNTPAGSGSATGTIFSLLVLPNRLSQFWVEAGEVSVVNENATVVVAAGQTTTIQAGQPPIEPAFRITGEGKVLQIGSDGGEGVIPPVFVPDAQTNKNNKISLCHATGSATNPYVEISVSVDGATNGHAKHPGDIIPAPADGCPKSLPITSSTTSVWDIAGQLFHTGADTAIFGNPQPGDWVRFEGHLQTDGSYFADRIELLTDSPNNQVVFIGTVESIGETAWTVSSRMVQINEFSALDDGLKVGDTVQVMGEMAEDGSFWATRIYRTEGAGSDFHFAGILTSMGTEEWVISGIKVMVDGNTALNGDFVAGHPVVVEGVIREDGTWLATNIDLVTPGGYRFEFSGVVQSISPWIVSEVGFDTDDWTEIDTDIQVGEQVRVAGLVSADGIWVAEKIERLDTEHAASFAFFGPVLSIDPWNVGGVPLIVDERTTIKDEILLNEMVKVTGWILEDGTWLATEIKHTGLHLGQGCFTFSSIVESINDNEIILTNGQKLVRSENLEEQGDIIVGSLVRYQYCVDKDGVGRVVRIIVAYQMEDYPPTTETGKAVICHIPPGNPGNQHTIEIGLDAVSAHLAHGDTQGPCSSEKPDKKPKKNN